MSNQRSAARRKSSPHGQDRPDLVGADAVHPGRGPDRADRRGVLGHTSDSYVPLTLVSDRAGLVMESGAKVKLRGVQVGQVASIGTDVKAAQLQLKMDPGPFKYLPSNLEAEIKSTTAFGSKYVDLIVPDQPSPQPLKPGAVLHSRNVTVEVNTVFENLQSVVGAIDPAKLNAVLSAFAQALRGKGERLGQAITDANNVLLTVNPRMATIRKDWQLFGKTAAAYSDAAQDILSILDSVGDDQRHHHRRTSRRWTHCCCRRSASPEPASTSIGTKRVQHGARRSICSGRPLALLQQIFTDLHLPVPGRPMVLGARRSGRIGRQRLSR